MSTSDPAVEPSEASQPPRPPRSPSPSPHSTHLALITEGRVFTLYSFSPTLLPPPSSSPPTQHLHTHPIFLFYSPPPPFTTLSSSTNLGAFHWSTPGTRTLDPTTTLPITHISDIYLDCQHGVEWTSLTPPHPPPGLCFTLVSKRRDLRLWPAGRVAPCAGRCVGGDQGVV